MRQNIKELFRYYDYLLKVEHLFNVDFGTNLEARMLKTHLFIG
ncbi:hypothetical protein HELA111659_10720 [Helicobacter labetoulli]